MLTALRALNLLEKINVDKSRQVYFVFDLD